MDNLIISDTLNLSVAVTKCFRSDTADLGNRSSFSDVCLIHPNNGGSSELPGARATGPPVRGGRKGASGWTGSPVHRRHCRQGHADKGQGRFVGGDTGQHVQELGERACQTAEYEGNNYINTDLIFFFF